MALQLQTKVVLTVIKGPDRGRNFEFTEQDNFLVGRDAKGSYAHYRLSPEDKTVSRNHFLLEINPPDCYIRDAGSLNGTFIKRGNTLFFLKGRKERNWLSFAQYIAARFSCNLQEVEKNLKLEDGDIIIVGNTMLEVKIFSEISEVTAIEAIIRCIRCNRDITEKIRAKEHDELTSEDFICNECKGKEKKTVPEESIICWECGKDITSLANFDGRAKELKDIALYWCEDCALKKQVKGLPIERIKQYYLLKWLGGGGFGDVYLAWDKNTGRIGALKITKEKIKRNKRLLERFKREIAIMKELSHPHLVRLYDGGLAEDEAWYFFSEYLPEGNLADILYERYGGKMPYKDACYFIVQTLEGLSYFHEKGFVHRDLSPENVLIRKNKEGKLIAKIGDFGLAKSYILHGGTITKPNEWAGKILYCPPEQITSFKNVKPYTDIYAIGIIFYYIITGKFPYDFPTKKELFDMISRGVKLKDPLSIILGKNKPIPIEERAPDIPQKLAEAINKAIEKDYKKRFSTAKEFKKVIERYAI